MRRVDRACVVWVLLTLSAIKRQTLTYHLLAKLLGVSRNDLGPVLEPIQSYCILENLPPLTSLVVNAQTGIPNAGFIAEANLPQAQADVWGHDWLAQSVPAAQDFEQALAALPSCGLSLDALLKQIR